MIRPTTREDVEAILTLAVSCELFPHDGTDEVAGVLSSSLSGELGPDHVWLTDDENGTVVGVAYYAPERLAEGTWNLFMLAVHPERQRQGRGKEMVRRVEEALSARGARLLLIESSGLGTYERTRAFYRALGYTEEARIRDFYAAGDDKVVFRKAIDS
ncbi:MAG: GNAT family N-acetyltransferase [Isosphaeraceae bacterium]|nr:GNAT family N-acetyltransferase [Isosphaeraceae bacterium]